VMDDYPAWICEYCGTRYGNGPQFRVSTWHMDTCGICGRYIGCTEPRDWHHLRPDWREAYRRANHLELPEGDE
jgi:hypothetical protein